MNKNIVETYKSDKFEDQTAGYIGVDGSFIFVEEYHGEEDNEYKDLGLPEFSSTHYEEDVCVRIYKEPNEIQYEKLEEIIDHFLNTFSYCKVEIWDKPNKNYSFYNVYSLFEGACKDSTWNEKVGNWTGYKLVQIIKNNINKLNEEFGEEYSSRLREELLLELKRSQLINKSKNGASYAPNNRKKGKNRFERRKYSKISTSIKGYNKIDMNAFWKGDILEVGIEVIGETDNYIVTLDFENILYNLKKEVKDNNNVFNFKVIYKALVKAFNDDDVYMSCTCLHPDTKIKLLDGTCPTVAEMKTRFDAGEKLYVYSTDDKGDFKPGEVEKVWVTGEKTEFIKVTLDSGKEIITTPDHLYMLRDGSYIPAEDLTEGQSLMPMYFNYSANGYEMVKFNSEERGWHTIYKLVADYFKHDEIVEIAKNPEAIEKQPKGVAIHHLDFNKANNTPENLAIMTAFAHWMFHSDLANTRWKDPEWCKMQSERARKHIQKLNANPTEAMLIARKIWHDAGVAHNYDPEWKPVQAEICRKAITKWWENLTEEEYEAKCKLISEQSKKNWVEGKYDTEAFHKAAKQRGKDTHTPEREKLIHEGVLHYWANISDEERERRAKESASHLPHLTGPFTEEHKKHMSEAMLNRSEEEKQDHISKIRKTKIRKALEKMLDLGIELTDAGYEEIKKIIAKESPHNHIPSITSEFTSIDEAVSYFKLNHKVVKIERITLDSTPVYDIKVKDWENFVVEAGVVLHNCPDWRYRFGYVATKNKYSSQLPPELRPSNITNPKDDKGAGCKHTLLLLSNTGWLVKIASVIYNYVKYCKTNLSTNYKRYIFPQIYGMSYKQALDSQIFKEVDNDVSGLLPSDQKALDDIINRALKGRDEKGRFTKGNEYAFNKKDLRNLN